MSLFSEKLGAFIERSRLTEQQLSKASGFTRSYIALMKSGLRISPDTRKMADLFDALGLTPYEREELWADYMRAKFGDDTFELRRRMISLIQSFNAAPPLRIRSGFEHEIPDVSAVHGRSNVEQIVRTVIEKEASEESPHLRLILQPDLPSLFSTILARHVSDPRMKIEQIFGFEQGTEKELPDRFYNLKAYEWIVPMIVHSEGSSCRFYYYYDRIQAHFNTNTLLPYLVLTQKYAVSISVDYECALVTDRPEQLKMFSQLFTGQRDRCFEVGLPLREYSRQLGYRLSAIPEKGQIYSLASQPRLSLVLTDEILDKYLSSEPEVRALAGDIMRRERELLSKSGPASIFFTEEGVKRFMEEGIVDLMSGTGLPPIEPADRKRMLEHLIRLIRDGKLKAFLLEESQIVFPKELSISAYDRKQVSAVYLSEDPESRMALSEHTLMEMIYAFLEGLENSPYVRPLEETLSYLQKCVLQQQV